MEVVLRNRRFIVERNEVETLLKSAHIEEEPQASYFIVVEGRELPVKKALKRVLGEKGISLTLLEFTSQDAVRIFKRLGFEVVKRGKGNIMEFAGAIKGGGNAVEDKEKLYEGFA